MRLPGATQFMAAWNRRHSLSGETVGIPPEREPRGSPFQTPAGLADGLGPESDPGSGVTAARPISG
jgi:hypothetical protein